jgi:hypothetical protein
MASVYSPVSHVVVWLGEADENTSMVFELIRNIGAQIICLVEEFGLDRVYSRQDPRLAFPPLDLSPEISLPGCLIIDSTSLILTTYACGMDRRWCIMAQSVCTTRLVLVKLLCARG